MVNKISWHGEITSVQPRICLNRSFDQRSHAYLGYVLCIKGTIGGEKRDFLIGIGKGAQAKHSFRVGYKVQGLCLPVADPRIESAEFYKVSKLKIVNHSAKENLNPPPWLSETPDLPVYRARGHRRLDARTYKSRCESCVWGCRMAVEITVDHWNPSIKRYRYETFCYGPKSCSLYRAGPIRKVPGRKGMVWEEEDWVDEDATCHRGPDD